jgi:hypothetical protein
MKEDEWTKSEKKIARRAFDKALEKEYNFIIKETKRMALNASKPSDIWEIRDYLTRTLKQINRKYDYRYSRIIFVLGMLLQKGLISLDDLKRLNENKVEQIKNVAGKFGFNS